MAEIEGFKKSYLLILLLKIGVLFNFEIHLSSSFEQYGHFGHSVNLKFWRQLCDVIFQPKIKKVKRYDCEEH
jgi:hypothetical protein